MIPRRLLVADMIWGGYEFALTGGRGAGASKTFTAKCTYREDLTREEIEREVGALLDLVFGENPDLDMPLYFKGKCTCQPLHIVSAGRIFIRGEDDCPVHGFGTGEEEGGA